MFIGDTWLDLFLYCCATTQSLVYVCVGRGQGSEVRGSRVQLCSACRLHTDSRYDALSCPGDEAGLMMDARPPLCSVCSQSADRLLLSVHVHSAPGKTPQVGHASGLLGKWSSKQLSGLRSVWGCGAVRLSDTCVRPDALFRQEEGTQTGQGAPPVLCLTSSHSCEQ